MTAILPCVLLAIALNVFGSSFVSWTASLSRTTESYIVGATSVNFTDDPNFWHEVEAEFVSWLAEVKSQVQNEPRSSDYVLKGPNLTTIIVDWNGNGDFTSLQGAIDSVPEGNSNPTIIQVNAGTYFEKVTVPVGKSFITLKGQGRTNTFIVWNDTASGVSSTYLSASVAVNSEYFTAFNVTFQNSAPAQPPGAIREQAVAFRISADHGAFYGCGFIAHQDTLYDHKGKHYFEDCYIEGSVDFIFGNGQSLYKNCELRVVPYSPGALTAQKRSSSDSITGFSFLYCAVTGTGVAYLGRAWGPYSRVVYAYTWMNDIIFPNGWNDWGDFNRTETVYYGQYKCTGPGALENSRVPWAHELTDAEAQPFLGLGFINGEDWVPVSD